MILSEREIELKNGTKAILKTAETDDAEKMIAFIKQVSGETEFLSHYPEEWTMSVEQEKGWINHLRSADDILNITCFIDGEIAGNCDVRFPSTIKTAHRSVIDIAVRRDFWNLGIASHMFPELIKAAEAHGSEIMELECFEGNERAVALYKKFGFEVACIAPKAYKLKDGTYQGKVYMQKYL
ncbi:MAG: GNAT family N-acetyltransferase [Clostridia bacterium]|nr:GNAT family N-acetyltransferase [Clostridia bacterium]